ncbi:MAG: GNAT family N-acetyltransferase [Rheinheimera sp.]|nr:GNAT family N-acetyltransferase [Rheinheimera sp.]
MQQTIHQSFTTTTGVALTIAVEAWQPERLDEYLALYRSSGIKRPLADPSRMAKIFAGANLTLSARIDGKLVGLARCLTDSAFVCYIADLLVAGDLQHSGIGRILLQAVADHRGPEVQQLLLSAPAAMGYYPKVGFQAINNAFAVQRKQ